MPRSVTDPDLIARHEPFLHERYQVTLANLTEVEKKEKASLRACYPDSMATSSLTETRYSHAAFLLEQRQKSRRERLEAVFAEIKPRLIQVLCEFSVSEEAIKPLATNGNAQQKNEAAGAIEAIYAFEMHRFSKLENQAIGPVAQPISLSAIIEESSMLRNATPAPAVPAAPKKTFKEIMLDKLVENGCLLTKNDILTLKENNYKQRYIAQTLGVHHITLGRWLQSEKTFCGANREDSKRLKKCLLNSFGREAPEDPMIAPQAPVGVSQIPSVKRMKRETAVTTTTTTTTTVISNATSSTSQMRLKAFQKERESQLENEKEKCAALLANILSDGRKQLEEAKKSLLGRFLSTTTEDERCQLINESNMLCLKIQEGTERRYQTTLKRYQVLCANALADAEVSEVTDPMADRFNHLPALDVEPLPTSVAQEEQHAHEGDSLPPLPLFENSEEEGEKLAATVDYSHRASEVGMPSDSKAHTGQCDSDIEEVEFNTDDERELRRQIEEKELGEIEALSSSPRAMPTPASFAATLRRREGTLSATVAGITPRLGDSPHTFFARHTPLRLGVTPVPPPAAELFSGQSGAQEVQYYDDNQEMRLF